jgi:hypothetical protein
VSDTREKKKRKPRRRRPRGTGSVFYRDKLGLWAGKTVVGHNPETGKARYKVVYGKTAEEAQAKLDDLRQKRDAGQVEAGEISLKGALGWWLDCNLKPRVDPATYALHKQRAEDYIVPHLGGTPVAGLSPYMVANWYADLEKKGVSADLRNKCGQLLRRCLKQCVEDGRVRKNVAAALPLPRARPEEMHWLNETEVKELLRVAARSRLYPLG